MDFILLALLIAIGLNLIMFIPAYFYKTDRLTDISYALTFIIIALIGFAHSSRMVGHFVLLVMVLLWAMRLGGFLYIRIRRMKKDSRFDAMRGNFWSFLRFWFFQGLSVFLVLAAALLAWDKPFSSVGVVSYIGWIVFGLGLGLEAAADWQKYTFNNSKTKDIWIDTGFWRISRHPNYLGEIMVWSGVYIFCLPALSGISWLLALASPLYISTILLFFSGIPLVEKAADKKWSSNKDYQSYKKAVPVLLPTISSLRRLK